MCEHPVEIVWTLAGYSTDTVRTSRDWLPYLQVRGWCLTKIPAFPFQKAEKIPVRLNVTKFSTDVPMTTH